MLLYAWFGGGGGMEAELNWETPCGDVTDCCDSNFIGGSDIKDAIDGCALAGTGLRAGGLVARASPFSEVYITATFVEGEFMVPVRDHPIAMQESILLSKEYLSKSHTLTWVYHW